MSTQKKLVTLNGLVVQYKLPYKRALAAMDKLTPIYEQPFGGKVAKLYDSDEAIAMIQVEFRVLFAQRKNAEVARAALEAKRKAGLMAKSKPERPARPLTPMGGGNAWTSMFASVERVEKKLDDLLNQLGVKPAT